MIINTWQFNLILTLAFVVPFYQFYKLAVKDVKKDGAATIILQLIAGISVLVWTPFFAFEFPSNLKTYGLLLLATVFYAINDRLETTARKNLEVSMFSVIKRLSTVFIVIIGLTVFKETFIVYKMLGISLILFGNTFLLYRKGKPELNKYVLLAVLANMAFAVAMSTDIGISALFNLPVYVAITLIVPALMVKLAERIPTSAIIEEYKNGDKKLFYATGVCWGLSILFSLRSFRFGQVTTIVPLQSAAVLLNVVVAYLFLKESDRLLKKILAAVIVMVGVSLTVFG